MVHVLRNILSAQDAKARASDALAETASKELSRALLSDPMFQLHARPAALSGAALLRNGAPLSPAGSADFRADLVVVIFLSSTSEYEGGELVLDAGWGEQMFKEDAGSCVIYPADARAEFRPAVSGAQCCARIFVQSAVRETAQREILYDVSRAARYLEIFKGGSNPATLRLKGCEDSLLRLWRDA
jgi:PKHD-type hydroxylase